MRYQVAALIVLATALAGTALGAATLVSPPPGARLTTSKPTFTWTLPANEESKGVFVSGSPDVEPGGGFLEVVAGGTFANDEHQWSPSSPLYAGHYWWLVQSSDRLTSQIRYSVPSDFTIPASLSVLPVSTVRSTYLRLLAIKVRWKANVHSLRVRLRVLRKRKVVWQRTESEPNVLGQTGSRTVSCYLPHTIKRGTRLTLQVVLRAGGVKKTRSLLVRAP